MSECRGKGEGGREKGEGRREQGARSRGKGVRGSEHLISQAESGIDNFCFLCGVGILATLPILSGVS
jgi:hypothetical protein